MVSNVRPLQKILFGSPGTGKSYQIRAIATEQLGIELDKTTKTLANTVKTVFHPEYTYADFMGKLLPQSQGANVIYKFYPGHFLQILGKAYQGLIHGKNDHYLLVIDELNRGNASAIFGTVFQLLDREGDHWSSYEIDLSDLELMGLFKEMGYAPTLTEQSITFKTTNSYQVFQDFFNG
jgi:5-methylcytosine-specific restriction endonuclease McrBC GTP-binding regulatory subunit McrB